ncbi:MAK10-like protein [Tanacetum coccineum]
MNRLNVQTLTPELLAGPTFELIKGTCKSLTELEYFCEEVYKAATEKLDWINLEGRQYPHDLRQPLPLVPNTPGHHLILFHHFINNDLEYLRGGKICSGPHDTRYCMENPEQAFVDYASSRNDEAGGKWFTLKPDQNNLSDTYNPSWKSHPNLRRRQPQNSQNNFSNPPNRFQPNGSFLNRSFNNNPQNFNNQSNLEGSVSNFMASQDARLSKFEADFKQQQSEMTNKIDTILKAITDQITRALPSDTVLEVLAHAPIYNAILDKYVESLELGKNRFAFIQDGTKSYPIRIVKDVEVHIGRLKLLNEFYVIDMKKDPETPLLVERGFLATVNAVIDCRKAKIAVGEGITRSVFRVKEINLDGKEFTKTFQSIPTSRKLSGKVNLKEIINLDHFHDT